MSLPHSFTIRKNPVGAIAAKLFAYQDSLDMIRVEDLRQVASKRSNVATRQSRRVLVRLWTCNSFVLHGMPLRITTMKYGKEKVHAESKR